MAESASSLLDRLAEMRGRYGGATARDRKRLLEDLGGRSFARPEEVRRFHELLCFLRAWPDDRQVLRLVRDLLRDFSSRPDLVRFGRGLMDTGIAGTAIHFRFYWITACWLARRWPRRLSIDWRQFENRDRLQALLDLLVTWSESPALDMVELAPREWLERLKGSDETDAAFLIRRFQALAGPERLRERIYERLDVPLRLDPGEGTPSRTMARLPIRRAAWQREPLRHQRPDLEAEARRPPLAVRELSRRRGARLIELAREAMVTRHRDLDAFAYADPRDVRMVEAEGGLRFACYGLRPERRLMLETSYGLLMLKNEVPIGYALASSLFASTEVAYNIFDTFRGGEAAWIFGRLLGTFRRLFGVDTFAIDPFQLGYGNAEGLASGAWWFYYKLGFRPRNREVRRVLRGELSKMKADPGHRSDRKTLERLASDYLFFSLGPAREGVMGAVDLGRAGLAVTDLLAGRFGDERERGLESCALEARKLLGIGSLAGWSPAEREAWRRWSPLLLLLPGIETWSRRERRELARVVRAKGGPREAEFLARFDRHPRLPGALLELCS